MIPVKFVEFSTGWAYDWINSAKTSKGRSLRQEHILGRILKYLFFLVILGLIGLAGFALFSDLPAPSSEVTEPVKTNLSR